MKKFKAMHDFLMKNMKLMHYPVGFTFYYNNEQISNFKQVYEYHIPIRPLTLCQAELGARMEGLNILLDMEKIWCRSARIGFGLQVADEKDKELHAKFCENPSQVVRVLQSKPRLPSDTPPVALSLVPLANCLDAPDVVHFCCDNMQAYHLLNDWMATRDVHPLRPNLCVNSSVCGGSVFALAEQQANLTLACAGSYNSGKMERGEINVMIPGKHLSAMIQRMRRRVKRTGGISLTRPGQPFPGVDICQNCPLILFKKGD